MSLKPWKKISEEVVHDNLPWWNYILENYNLPNGKNIKYHSISKLDAVAIIPIDRDGKIVCIEQYRPLIKRISLEIPIGSLKKGQTPEEAAIAELGEEASRGAKCLEKVGAFFSCNGIVNEKIHVFIAWDLSANNLQADETEEFEEKLLTPNKFEAMIFSGEIDDGEVIASWFLAKPRVLAIIDAQRLKS